MKESPNPNFVEFVSVSVEFIVSDFFFALCGRVTTATEVSFWVPCDVGDFLLNQEPKILYY